MGADVVSKDANGYAFDVEADGQCAASSSSSGSIRRRRTVASSSSSCSTQHRRSKSASDRSVDLTKHEASYCIRKSSAVSQRLMGTTQVEKALGTSHQDCSGKDCHTISHHRASLENDIKQLQMCLQREKSVRDMLEKAIGRTSSTLSPGHKNFATQTRKLIEEIELLEEEVANSEQHVLSLYRAIIDQSLGGALPELCSGMTHPSHKRARTKKHPSVISCAFCSSRKFPIRRLQVMMSIKDSWKKRMLHDVETTHPLTTNANIQTGECPDTIKVNQEAPMATKHFFFYTMRDHLYQYPNKLSEELVKCMVAVYSFVCNEPFIKQDEGHLPCPSGSSTNAVLRQKVTEDDREWPSRSTVEISWISTGWRKLSNASSAISSYRSFVGQLQKVDVNMLGSNAKLAFWINVYNSLVMQAHLTYGLSRSFLKRITLFHKWFDTMISTAMRKRAGEDKLSRISFVPFPVTCFALCTGAYSDPAINVYTARNVMGELEEAKKEFLQANVIVKGTSKVFLPKLLDRFAKEASMSSDDLLAWVSENVDKELHNAIQKCMDSHPRRKTSQAIEWIPYEPRFRYVFARDLIEKARCV